MRRLNVLSLVGALAAAGFLLNPVLASADINKCGKETVALSAKMQVDTQKELAKCVSGYFKEVDKAAANVAKGKTASDKAFAGLWKGAGKCQKSLAKIYGNPSGDKVTLASDIGAAGAEKGKLGKGYNKINGPGGLQAKGKCGTKLALFVDAPDELELLGLGRDFDLAGRILAAAAVESAVNDVIMGNQNALEAFDNMIPDRCVKTGVTCFADTDCPLNPGFTPQHPKNTIDDVCTTECPDCTLFGRAITAAGPVVAGAYTGPCGAMTCELDGATLINNIAPPVTIPVTFTGLINMAVCDDSRILAGAYTVHGRTDRTNKAALGPLTVCVDTIGANGYIKKDGAVSPPAVDLAACSDGNLANGDSCSSFTACQPPASRTDANGVDLPGPQHVTCLDTTSPATSAAAAAGDAAMRLSLRITTVSPGAVGTDTVACTGDDTAAPGGVTTIGLTTKDASANLFDSGTGGTFGLNSGSVGPITGVPFDVSATGIDSGHLTGGDLVGAFTAIDSDGSALLGDSITDFRLSCL